MTGRKTAADNEGWRKGQGAYSQEVKLNRSPTSWDYPLLSDGDEGLAVADKAAKYTRNEDAGLCNKLPEEVRAGNNQAGVGRDIFDEVEANQPDDTNRAIKSRGGQS
jgi:hypothetical protein